MEKNNKARRLYEDTIKKNNEEFAFEEDMVYREEPVLLIHKVRPSAMSESDLLSIHSLTKEQRRLKRLELVNGFRLDLLRRYKEGDLSLDELLKLVKEV
jgi:hypothetical protein